MAQLSNDPMQILTVDIGTGTQDIFLYNSQLNLENGYKLVVPAPTMIVNRQIKQATQHKQAILLTGLTMGGGPSQWAAEAHLRAGLPVFATPDAGRSFNDNLAEVKAMGITLVSEDEAAQLPSSILRLELRDFDYPSIANSLSQLGVRLDKLAAVAVAVFDHGEAPAHYSDRQFRFDYLDQRIRQQNRLSAFSYRSEDIPPCMTRLGAVARSVGELDVPLIVMDTAPAAVLGATFDPQVAICPRIMIANVGNFHTLAFRLGPDGIEGVFEHHTGLLDASKLDDLLRGLAAGTLRHTDVFDHQGHGALIYSSNALPIDQLGFGVAVTGPRRSLMDNSSLRPHFAVPFGDMMISGCFGLLAAVADAIPELSEPILVSMHGRAGNAAAPWDVE